ncbi:MAG: ARMT1-like domain-containing protein [Candidatus Omnitrophota bacterium]
MIKRLITFTLLHIFLIENAGVSYLCPEALAKGYALRPVATSIIHRAGFERNFSGGKIAKTSSAGSVDLELAREVITQLKEGKPCPFAAQIIDRLLGERPDPGIVLNPETYTPGPFRFQEIENVKIKKTGENLFNLHYRKQREKAAKILQKIENSAGEIDSNFRVFLDNNLIDAIVNLSEQPGFSKLTHPQFEELRWSMIRLFSTDWQWLDKEIANNRGRDVYSTLRERIKHTLENESFESALKEAIYYSAVGNGLETEYYKQEFFNFDDVEKRKVEIGSFFDELFSKLKPRKGKIAFYLDNAGEIFMDLLVIELLLEHGFEVVLMAKEVPTTDDLTKDDVIKLLNELVDQAENPEYQWISEYYSLENILTGKLTVVSSGSLTPATDLNKLTIDKADSILNIYKGGGNYYGTYPASMNADAFYVFMIKEHLQAALVMEAGVSKQRAKRGNLVFQYKAAKTPGKRIGDIIEHGGYFVIDKKAQAKASSAGDVEDFGDWFDLRHDIQYYDASFIRGEAKGLEAIQEQVRKEKSLFVREDIKGVFFYFDSDLPINLFLENKILAKWVKISGRELSGQINVIIVDKGPKAIINIGNTIAINRGVINLIKETPLHVQDLVINILMRAALSANTRGNVIKEGYYLGIDRFALEDNRYRSKPSEVISCIRQIFYLESKIASNEQEEILIWLYSEGVREKTEKEFSDIFLDYAIRKGFTTVVVRFLEGDVANATIEIIFGNSHDILSEKINVSPDDMGILFSAIGKDAEPKSEWRYKKGFFSKEIKQILFIMREKPRIMTEELLKRLDELEDKDVDGRSFGLIWRVQKDTESIIGKKIRIEIIEEPEEDFFDSGTDFMLRKYSAKEVFDLFNNLLYNAWAPREGRKMWEFKRFLRLTIKRDDITPREKFEKIITFFKNFAQGKKRKGAGMVEVDDPIKAINRYTENNWVAGYAFEEELLDMFIPLVDVTAGIDHKTTMEVLKKIQSSA